MREFISILEQVAGLFLLTAGLWQHNGVAIACGAGAFIGGTVDRMLLGRRK